MFLYNEYNVRRCLVLLILILSYLNLNPNTGYSAGDKIKEPALVYKAKGDRYRRIGLLDKALNEYDKAVSIKKDFPEVYYWSAYIYTKKRLFIQALFEIELAKQHKNKFALNSKYYDLLFLETDIYIKMKQNNKARELLDRIIFILKENIKNIGVHSPNLRKYFYYELGKTYFYKGKFIDKESMEKKLNHFDKAISYNYEKDLAYYNKYLLYSMTLDKTKAELSLQNALKINPNIILYVKRLEK